MIWIITAMLVYEDPSSAVYTDYLAKSFDSKIECHNHIYYNKVHLIDGIFENYRFLGDEELTTFSFFCESRHVKLEDV